VTHRVRPEPHRHRHSFAAGMLFRRRRLLLAWTFSNSLASLAAYVQSAGQDRIYRRPEERYG
jgi:hypothetical protein